jgi:hypothetical protein
MARPVRFNPRNQKPEGDFKKAVRKYLRLIFSPYYLELAIFGGFGQRPGSPDMVCGIRGLFVSIEFKASKDVTGRQYVVGKRQQEWMDEAIAAGCRAGIVATWEDLDRLIEGIEPVQRGFKRFGGKA